MFTKETFVDVVTRRQGFHQLYLDFVKARSNKDELEYQVVITFKDAELIANGFGEQMVFVLANLDVLGALEYNGLLDTISCLGVRADEGVCYMLLPINATAMTIGITKLVERYNEMIEEVIEDEAIALFDDY